MKYLKFNITRSFSSWRTGESKAPSAAYRLSIVCNGLYWVDEGKETEAQISPAIFAYMRHSGEYTFNHVCSAVDMFEIPEEEGTLWCRKKSVDLLFPSVELAEESLEEIEDDLRFLAREIVGYNNLIGTKTYEVA